MVKLLNDRFGVQTRGGCACAGTYGHILLNVDALHSYEILEQIHHGDLSCKPGWIRMSVHPVMTDAEVDHILHAIEQVALHFHEWKNEYTYDTETNEYQHQTFQDNTGALVHSWFEKKFS